jgi:hypothetical protein
MERFAHIVEVRQVFGLDLGINDIVRITHLGLGVEAEALDAFAAELEL